MSWHVLRHTFRCPAPPPPLHVMVARRAQVTQVTQVPTTQHNTTQRRPHVTRHTQCGGTAARHGPSPPRPPWLGKLPCVRNGTPKAPCVLTPKQRDTQRLIFLAPPKGNCICVCVCACLCVQHKRKARARVCVCGSPFEACKAQLHAKQRACQRQNDVQKTTSSNKKIGTPKIVHIKIGVIISQ